MPKITEYGKTFRDWEGLLGACAQNASSLQGGEALKTALETLLNQARELKVEQEGFAGQKKAVTERLQKTVTDGREAARKLRAHVQSQIGTKTELLSAFGIAPSGKKGKKKPTELKPPADGVSSPKSKEAE
jgi:hypothetical protein